MAKEEGIELEGTIVESLKGRFRVELDQTGTIIMAHLGGKLRKHYIRCVPGDRVVVEVSPYDTTKGRIIYRQK